MIKKRPGASRRVKMIKKVIKKKPGASRQVKMIKKKLQMIKKILSK